MTSNLEDYSTDEEENGPNTKMSKKERRKAAKAKKYKSTFQQVCKYLFLGSSISLIAVAALRFTVVELYDMHDTIMNFYFLFFGVVLAL